MKALLVIDVQNGVYSYADFRVLEGERTVATINGLIRRARLAGSPVVFVQHEDDAMERGSHEWELVSAFDARSDDNFVAKQHASAFHGTPLGELLTSLGINQIVLCGMQTELCVDSTCRHAVALGYDVELASDAHTTYDTRVLPASKIVEHHNQTLQNYVDVLAAESIRFP